MILRVSQELGAGKRACLVSVCLQVHGSRHDFFLFLIMSMLDISGLDAAPLENVRLRLRKTVPAG